MSCIYVKCFFFQLCVIIEHNINVFNRFVLIAFEVVEARIVLKMLFFWKTIELDVLIFV